jgi:hypothetical protein
MCFLAVSYLFKSSPVILSSKINTLKSLTVVTSGTPTRAAFEPYTVPHYGTDTAVPHPSEIYRVVFDGRLYVHETVACCFRAQRTAAKFRDFPVGAHRHDGWRSLYWPHVTDFPTAYILPAGTSVGRRLTELSVMTHTRKTCGSRFLIFPWG